jgi:hypothetical protein
MDSTRIAAIGQCRVCVCTSEELLDVVAYRLTGGDPKNKRTERIRKDKLNRAITILRLELLEQYQELPHDKNLPPSEDNHNL